ncbi:MAG: hypothetical protein Q4C96_10740 [Planctomycetia bacterium]|nr:hypothetical protein [Planctomycetia bacterium]
MEPVYPEKGNLDESEVKYFGRMEFYGTLTRATFIVFPHATLLMVSAGF